MNQKMDGALLVNKPVGPTSSGVIQGLQKFFPRGERPKIGHAGTLDPFAQGLLVVLFGEATKLSDWLLKSDKTYEGRLQFGIRTDSGDLTGETIETSPGPYPSIEVMEEVAQTFLGQPYPQTPPMHSAKKIDGTRLYTLARKGISVEREAREVQIRELQILSYESPLLRFHTKVSAGTYIRVLAEDWAKKAGSIAHLTYLTRIGSSSFSLEQALPLNVVQDHLANGTPVTSLTSWIPIPHLFHGFTKFEINRDDAVRVRYGQKEWVETLITEKMNSVSPLANDQDIVLLSENLPIAILSKTPPHRIARVFPAV